MLRYGAEIHAQRNLSQLSRLSILLTAARACTVVLALAAISLFYVSIARTFNFPSIISDNWVLICLVIVVSCVNPLWGTALHNIRMDQVQESITRIVMQVLRVIGFALAIFLGFGLSGVIAAWLATLLVAWLQYSMANFRWWWRARASWPRQVDSPVQNTIVRRLVRFSAFAFAGNSLMVLKEASVANFVIAHHLGVTHVALYGLASTLVILLANLSPASLLRGVLTPLFTKRYTERKDSGDLVFAFNFTTKLVLLVTVPTLIIFAILGDKVIELVYGPDYLSAYLTLVILCIAHIVWALQYPYSPIIYALEKSELVLFSSVAYAMPLVTSLVLVPQTGIVGAAIGSATGAVLLWILNWAAFRWYVRVPLGFPVRTAFTIALHLLPIAAALLLLKPYVNSLAALIVAGIVSVVCYVCLGYWNHSFFSPRELNLMRRAVGRPSAQQA